MFKVGDKVRIRGVEGVHTVEANHSHILPLRAGGETFTVYGKCYDDDAIAVELVEEAFEFKIGDKVKVRRSDVVRTLIENPDVEDRIKYPLYVQGGSSYTHKGEYLHGSGLCHLTLVERPAFVFEIGDKVAFKGWESMEHFILHPNDLDDEEDYPFKAISSNGKSPSFAVTSDGRISTSNPLVAIVLIERPEKLSFEQRLNKFSGILKDGTFKEGLAEGFKESLKEQQTVEPEEFFIIDDPRKDGGVSPEKLEEQAREIFEEWLPKRIKEITSNAKDSMEEQYGVIEGLESEKNKSEPTEAQLEAFTKGVEHAERLARYVKGGHFHGSSEEFIIPKKTKAALPVRCQVVEGGKLPTYAHDGDAGMDLYVRAYERADDEHIKYYLGIKLDLDEGYAAFIFPRSSVYKSEQILSNCVGVVDSGYKGEISAVFKKHTSTQFMVGDRACQMVIMPVPKVRLVEVEELRDSVRGSNGYGSTGK